MSKSLRMLLLSMLVVVMAAMPAMAANITFQWTGAAGNNSWGDYKNWSADVTYDSTTHGDANNFYPGKIAASVASVDVVISKDAAIYLDQQNGNGFTTGALSNIRVISIDAKVSIDLGEFGYFIAVPNIAVSGDLKLTGTRTLAIDRNPTWSSNGAMTLSLPVSFNTGCSLTLSVDNAPLTISNASLLNRTTVKVSGSNDSKNKGKLILGVQPNTAANGRRLTIRLTNGAELNTPSNITLYANWDTNSADRVPVITGDTLIKTGSGVLTFSRTNITSYDTPISSDVKTIDVKAGSIVFGSRRIAVSALNVNVAADANLAVNAARAVETSKDVVLVVSGDAEIATAGIGTATSVYTSSVLTLTPFNLSADVRSTGTLTFKGTQPIKSLKGTGTVTVSGDSILIIDGTSADISGFTGTLNATNVGVAEDFDDLPFADASADIATIYVYGEAELTLDSAKLKGVEGMDATTIFLRSNYNAVTEAALTSSYVGSLNISGDVTLGTIRVDGAKTTPAVIAFTDSDDKLTVNSLVLHANKPLDTSTPTYSAVNALVISGEGTFVPKAMSNTTSSSGLGSNRSITVQNGATLKLDIDIPAYNSLMLNGGKLNAANGVSVPGDFTIQDNNSNYLKVAVTSDNGSGLFASGHNALNVGGNFNLTGHLSIDMTLDDEGKFLGKRYKLVGPAGTDFSKVNSEDVSFDVVGTYNGVMIVSFDIHGIYGILDKLIQLPQLGKGWTITEGAETFGSGRNEFVAKLSYDMPVNVTPASVLNLLNISIDIAGQRFSNTGTTRQLVTQNGENVVYIASLELNSKDREVVLTGTSYVTELDTKVALSWSKASKDWAPYANKIYYGSRKIESQDFRDLDWVELTISNPTNPSEEDKPRSQDVVLDDVVEVTISSPTTTFEAGANASFDFIIHGMTVAPATSSMPSFVNGAYVWNNGISAEDEYVLNGEIVKDFQIFVNGVSIDMTSVVLTPSGNNMIVSVPVNLLGSANGYIPDEKALTITAKAVSDNATLTLTGPTVVITAVYTEGEVDANQKTRTVKVNELPTNDQRIAEYTMTDPVSADATVNGAEKPAWLTLNVSGGVVAYALTADAPVGTHNISIQVWNAQGAYKYDFTITVAEGFKVNFEELYDTYANWNYEAHFTAVNAPAGTLDWVLSNDNSWLQSARSGDMFVVYGQLPPYVDDEDNDDANNYTYTVTARVGTEAAPAVEMPITVDADDTDEIHTGEFSSPAVGTITHNNNRDLFLANRNYRVDIDLGAEYYGELDIQRPYWLASETKYGGEDNDEVVGYTLSVKPNVYVNGGIVRFDDPESGVVQWAIIFSGDQPAPGPDTPDVPQSPDLALRVSQPGVSLDMSTLGGNTAAITLTAINANGAVSYDYTVAPADGLTVEIADGVATLTATTVGDYTVTFKATDAAGRTAQAIVAVTVSSGLIPGPQIGKLSITATPNELTFIAGENLTQAVTMTATIDGVAVEDVEYKSNQDWAVVDGNIVMVTAPEASGTITITGTADGQTATTTITVTVTNPVVSTFSLQRRFASRSFDIRQTPVSFDIDAVVSPVNNQGTVNYTWAVAPTSGLSILESSGVVTLTATRTGTYTVTITGTDSATSQTANTTITVVITSSGSVGSSGGGCDAGFGALALALAVPLFLRRRRS